MMMTTLPSNSKLKLPRKIVVTIFAPQKLPPIRPWIWAHRAVIRPYDLTKTIRPCWLKSDIILFLIQCNRKKVIGLNNNRFGFPLLSWEVHDDTSNQSRRLISYAHRPLRNAMRLPFKSHWSVFYCDYWPFLYH